MAGLWDGKSSRWAFLVTYVHFSSEPTDREASGIE